VASKPAKGRTGSEQWPARRPMHPRAREQRLEMAAGILGFFTVVFFIYTVVMEISGGDALASALFLLGFAVLLGVVLQKRWKVFSRR
jgi:hypothetical protein